MIDLPAAAGVPLRPELEPGVPTALRRLVRLATSDVSFDRGCGDGLWHGAVDATVGGRTKTFNAHRAPTLAMLLDALADAVEAERRRRR